MAAIETLPIHLKELAIELREHQIISDDDQLGNQDVIEEYDDLLHTGIHEFGHVAAIENVGGKVVEVSNVREGAIKGKTGYKLPGFNRKDYLIRWATAALGGYAAASISGRHHHGCDSDLSTVNQICEILSSEYNVSNPFSQCLSRAMNAVNNRGRKHLRQKSLYLIKKRKIA